MLNRKAALEAAIWGIKRLQEKGNWSPKMLKIIKDFYEVADREGKKKEYAGIVIWYLCKKLKHERQ